MAKRIVCVTASEDSTVHGTTHVNEVGIGSLEGVPEYHEGVETVRDNLDSGDTYYTNVAGVRANVVTHDCKTCGFETIQTVDADGDGQPLDALPAC